jgi:hypothetical protein
MKGSGPRLERETIINFNEEENLAWVWTASETVCNRLKRLGFAPDEDRQRSATFILPKQCVRLPRKPRQLTESHKEALKKNGFKPK